MTDRTDPQLVHLDGLNLSGAWGLKGVTAALPADDPTRPVLRESAARHTGSVPVLPENPGRLKDTRLEFWLRTTTREAEALEKLTKQPLARQLVQRYFEATLPDLAALTEERTVTSVGQWLVISIGATKAD